MQRRVIQLAGARSNWQWQITGFKEEGMANTHGNPRFDPRVAGAGWNQLTDDWATAGGAAIRWPHIFSAETK
jgi:hypothetical protein